MKTKYKIKFKAECISLLMAAVIVSGISASAEVMRLDLEADANMAYEAVPGNGKCGDSMTWELTEDGTLTFSGSGDMYDYYKESTETESGSIDTPWTENSNAKAILNVVIPEGVTSISRGAFFETRISTVLLPDSVRNIENTAFSSCARLKIAVLSDEMEYLPSGGFISCSSLRYIHIPRNLKKIGPFAFEHLSSLKSIELPDGITEIGEYAFCDAYNLNSIRIPSKVTVIQQETFAICDNLSEVSFPAGLKRIERSAFNSANKLTNVALPDGLESIGDRAFASSERTSFEIYVPQSVTEIGKDAFGYKGITIYGYEGSYAEKYAKENAKSNGITFVPVTETMYKERSAYDYPTKAEFIAAHRDYIESVEREAEEGFKTMKPQLTVIPGEPIAIYNNLDKIVFADAAQPFIDDAGRTQIPVRAAAESMGCTVEWDSETETVTITKGDRTISVTIGENMLHEGNAAIEMDTVAQNLGGYTYIPLRYVAERLGYMVAWTE